MSALAKLHIAKKELGLDDPTYRAMLLRLTGQESARGLDDGQIGVVLDEMKAKGWTPKVAARAGKPTAARADHPMARKARALWISLYELGEVTSPGESALEAFAKRQLGAEKLQWADQGQSYKLIEALKAWAKRAGWTLRQGADVHELRLALANAQAKRLLEIGYGAGAASADLAGFTDAELDVSIRAMGVAIRQHMPKKASST